MTFIPPRLHFKGRAPDRLPSLGRVLRDPLAHWPEEVLHRPFLPAMAGGERVVLIADPGATNEILMNRGGGFGRSALHDRILAAAYGEHLVRMDSVAGWRTERREIAQPMSTPRAEAVAPRLWLSLERMMEEWAKHPRDRPLDIVRDTRRLSLDMLWRAFFCDAESAQRAEPLVDEAALSIDALPQADTPRHVQELRPLAELATRRGTSESFNTGDAQGADLHRLLIFLQTGHDNTAATLCWALWLLAHQADWQRKVREEWHDARAGEQTGLGHRPVTGAVVRETLRLFPSILQLVRSADADLVIAGETLPRGFTAILNLYALHRSRLWWQDPDAFRPERFIEGADEIKRRLLWLPFGTGPRACIGAAFAQMELILALGTILSRFELSPVPGEDFTIASEWTLRPHGRRPISIRPLR